MSDSRSEFEAALPEMADGIAQHTFYRTHDGEYYNHVTSKTFEGRKAPNYASVQMLWECWQLARSASQGAVAAQVEPVASGMWLVRVRPAFLAGRGKYHRADHCGYTDDILHAGRFTESSAKGYAEEFPEKLEAIPDPYKAPPAIQPDEVAAVIARLRGVAKDASNWMDEHECDDCKNCEPCGDFRQMVSVNIVSGRAIQVMQAASGIDGRG